MMRPMTVLRRLLMPALVPVVIAACASTPEIRYYTLVPPAADGRHGGAPWFTLDVRAVPEQVDHPQLVVRTGPGRLALRESRQWLAPLASEVEAGLSAALGERVPGSFAPGSRPVELRLRVERFESVPASYVLQETSWSLLVAGAPDPLRCHSVVRVPVTVGDDALVAGHQQALQRLADAIVATVAADELRCPAVPGSGEPG